jgi:hypothetical protein
MPRCCRTPFWSSRTTSHPDRARPSRARREHISWGVPHRTRRWRSSTIRPRPARSRLGRDHRTDRPHAGASRRAVAFWYTGQTETDRICAEWPRAGSSPSPRVARRSRACGGGAAAEQSLNAGNPPPQLRAAACGERLRAPPARRDFTFHAQGKNPRKEPVTKAQARVYGLGLEPQHQNTHARPDGRETRPALAQRRGRDWVPRLAPARIKVEQESDIDRRARSSS